MANPEYKMNPLGNLCVDKAHSYYAACVTFLINAYLSISQKPNPDVEEKDPGPGELALGQVETH